MVPVLQPAGDRAHRRAARRPRLRRGDRQPALVPGADPRAARRRLAVRDRARLQPGGGAARAPPGGVRNAADFLGESVPGDLRRRAHRHRPGRDARVPRVATTGSRPWRPAASSDTSEFGVAITGDDGRVQGFQEKPDPAEALSDLANCGIYMFRCEIFDYFLGDGERSKVAKPDDPPGFADWAMDVLPGAAGERRPLLLARDRRLLERHRQPRRAAAAATSTRSRRGDARAGRRAAPTTTTASTAPSCSARAPRSIPRRRSPVPP